MASARNSAVCRRFFDVSFSLEKNSITSMIGPNGAGKSTFINVATGVYAPDTGRISFEKQDITGLSSHEIAGLGIGRTFQLEELFSSLTVLENAMVGCHTQSRCGMFSVGLKLPFATAEEKRIREEAMKKPRNDRIGPQGPGPRLQNPPGRT